MHDEWFWPAAWFWIWSTVVWRFVLVWLRVRSRFPSLGGTDLAQSPDSRAHKTEHGAAFNHILNRMQNNERFSCGNVNRGHQVDRFSPPSQCDTAFVQPKTLRRFRKHLGKKDSVFSKDHDNALSKQLQQRKSNIAHNITLSQNWCPKTVCRINYLIFITMVDRH